MICFIEGGHLFDWKSIPTVTLLSISAVMLFLFLKAEKKSNSPLLPVNLLKNDTFKKSAFGAAMAYITLFGLILYIPYLMQITLGNTAAVSGMMMIPMSLAIVLGGVIGGATVSKRQNYRQSGMINFLIAISGMSIMLIFGSQIPMPLLVIGVMLTGFGIGLNFPVINIAPQAFFPQSQLGILISTLEFFQVMGGVISMSVSGNIIQILPSGVIIFCIIALILGLITMSKINNKAIYEGFAQQQPKKEAIMV